jgi:hypothetical protein
LAEFFRTGEKQMKSDVKLSDIPLTAIANVVDYLEDDEEKDYSDNGKRNHIVHSVRLLKNFLTAINPDNPLERIRANRRKAAPLLHQTKEANNKITWETLTAMSNDELSKLMARFDYDSHKLVDPDTGKPFSAEENRMIWACYESRADIIGLLGRK